MSIEHLAKAGYDDYTARIHARAGFPAPGPLSSNAAQQGYSSERARMAADATFIGSLGSSSSGASGSYSSSSDDLGSAIQCESAIITGWGLYHYWPLLQQFIRALSELIYDILGLWPDLRAKATSLFIQVPETYQVVDGLFGIATWLLLAGVYGYSLKKYVTFRWGTFFVISACLALWSNPWGENFKTVVAVIIVGATAWGRIECE